MQDFVDIYREFHPRIYRYLRRFSSEAEALDLTQMVFVKVNRALSGFRGECSLATWIYRIANNTAHDHALSARERRRKSEMSLEDPQLVEVISDLTMTESEYIRREMNDCIRGLIARLPEKYRTVLLLSQFEGFSNPEIAEILGVTVATIKIRLHRARSGLREEMERHCSLYRDERNELMCDRKP